MENLRAQQRELHRADVAADPGGERRVIDEDAPPERPPIRRAQYHLDGVGRGWEGGGEACVARLAWQLYDSSVATPPAPPSSR